LAVRGVYHPTYTRKTSDEFEVYVRCKNSKEWILHSIENTRKEANNVEKILKKTNPSCTVKIKKKRFPL